MSVNQSMKERQRQVGGGANGICLSSELKLEPIDVSPGPDMHVFNRHSSFVCLFDGLVIDLSSNYMCFRVCFVSLYVC